MNFEIVYGRVKVCAIHAYKHKVRRRRAYAWRKRLKAGGIEHVLRIGTDIAPFLFRLTGER